MTEAHLDCFIHLLASTCYPWRQSGWFRVYNFLEYPALAKEQFQLDMTKFKFTVQNSFMWRVEKYFGKNCHTETTKEFLIWKWSSDLKSSGGQWFCCYPIRIPHRWIYTKISILLHNSNIYRINESTNTNH